VLLGLDGFGVLEARLVDGEIELDDRDRDQAGVVPPLRCAGGEQGPLCGGRA